MSSTSAEEPSPYRGTDRTFSPTFDVLIATGSEVSDEKLRLKDSVLVNGLERPRKEFPQLRGLSRNQTLATADIKALRLRTGRCPFCATRYETNEMEMRDSEDELPSFRVLTSFSFCKSCRHWEHIEWRTETYDARALLLDSYSIQLTQSKEREFETSAPEGVLAEIGQWFCRHPELYNSVEPRYLEKLVARVFAASGEYCEVVHVGRPDDGGVDVVLIEREDSKLLVQVKRREHPESVESVSTIRNLLGTLVLENSNRGIVVSTADHFSVRARQAAERAARMGFIVRLVDRNALDLLLAENIPEAPWSEILGKMESERRKWFGEPDCGIEFYPESERRKWYGELTSPFVAFNPNQIPLFDL